MDEVIKRWGLGRYFPHDGLFLASMPFLGSCVSYLFEVGYLRHYNAPISLIRMDITKVISANIAIGFLSALFIGAAITIVQFFSNSKTAIVKAFAGPLITIIVTAAFVGMSPIHYKAQIIIAFFAMLLLNQYGWPFFLGNKDESYSDRLKRQLDVDGHGLSLPTSGTPLAISVIIFAGALLIGYSQKFAEIKIGYFVDSTDETKFLIEVYDDTAVFGKYDPATRELKKGITIEKLERAELNLTLKAIGPLKNTDTMRDIFEIISGGRSAEGKGV